MTRINLKQISPYISYTIRDLSIKLGRGRRTVGRWMKAGLTIVPGKKYPILILGLELKSFLESRKKIRKFKLKPWQFYCMGCKKATYAIKGTITIVGYQKRGICRECGANVCRTIKPYQRDYKMSTSPVQTSIFNN
jgi:hypothetical protein